MLYPKRKNYGSRWSDRYNPLAVSLLFSYCATTTIVWGSKTSTKNAMFLCVLCLLPGRKSMAVHKRLCSQCGSIPSQDVHHQNLDQSNKEINYLMLLYVKIAHTPRQKSHGGSNSKFSHIITSHAHLQQSPPSQPHHSSFVPVRRPANWTTTADQTVR